VTHFHMCDVTHVHMCDVTHVHMCDVTHVHMCDVTHVHMCDVTHSYIHNTLCKNTATQCNTLPPMSTHYNAQQLAAHIYVTHSTVSMCAMIYK